MSIKKNKCASVDRFVPLRFPYDLSTKKSLQTSTNYSSYSNLIEKQYSPASKQLLFSRSKDQDNANIRNFIVKSINRKKDQLSQEILKAATKILDAPKVVNNFYFNVLSWSSLGPIAVGLGEDVFTYQNGRVQILNRNSRSTITSVKYHQYGHILYVGENTGRIQIYDICKNSLVRTLKSQYNRIGCIQNMNKDLLLTGSKDYSIDLHDIRVKRSGIIKFEGHKSEICGMTFSNDLLASSSNNSQVFIWDLNKMKLINTFNHCNGAIKAIKWCPWKHNLLAAAGGAKGRNIILWNQSQRKIQKEIDMQDQCTGLIWVQSTQEIVTSHGGASNCIATWDYKTPKLTQKLNPHAQRILNLEQNPNLPTELCSLGADETMRFWNLARTLKSQMKKSNKGTQKILNTNLR